MFERCAVWDCGKELSTLFLSEMIARNVDRAQPRTSHHQLQKWVQTHIINPNISQSQILQLTVFLPVHVYKHLSKIHLLHCAVAEVQID